MWEPRGRVLANTHHSQSCMTGSFKNVWANIPVIFALNGHDVCHKWLCVPYSPCIGIVLLRLDLCAKCLSNRAIIHGDIRYQLNWEYNNCCHECSLGIYLVIDTFFMYLVMLYPCIQILSNQEILHLKDFGDTASACSCSSAQSV